MSETIKNDIDRAIRIGQKMFSNEEHDNSELDETELDHADRENEDQLQNNF